MVRNAVALASNALERQVIAMWLGAGYVYSTIERRIRDKRRIYRRLGRDERDSRIARKLSCENVRRVAQYEAQHRPGDWKLHARIMRASLRAWADALRALRKLAVTTAANACICIRHFLRFLYRTRRIGTDLAPAVIGPTLRQMLKRPPENVSWTVIKRILGSIDRTRPLGKRDFAIFVTAA